MQNRIFGSCVSPSSGKYLAGSSAAPAQAAGKAVPVGRTGDFIKEAFFMITTNLQRDYVL